VSGAVSSSIWIPGLVVLGIGLGAGLLLARRFRAAAATSLPDLELRIADLEARRDDLYARLRRGDGGGDDRPALELAAARTLKALDEARAELGGRDERPRGAVAGSGSEAGDGGSAPRKQPAAAPGALARHPLLTGFLFGGATVALLAVLIYWAGRDAAPGAEAPMGQAELPADHPPVDGEVPAELSARMERLQGELQADPTDVGAQKELMLLQLSAGDYVTAFEGAEALVADNPRDPDGLFVQGVVRVAMGQNEMAVDLLDRVLADYPSHLQALVYRGLALWRSGQAERAVDTWETGLDMAGGRHPDFEELLAMARQEPAPTPPTASAGVPAAPPAAAAPAAAPAVAAGGYGLSVELPPGVELAPGAVLFVFLRPEPGGPPVAVRRIASPRFPLSIELGVGDSMMGGELPASGLLGARLDSDGSASTRDDGDLEAESAARAGTTTRLVLGR